MHSSNNKKKKRSQASTARRLARDLGEETVKQIEEAKSTDDVTGIAMTKSLERLGISPQSFIRHGLQSMLFYMVNAVVPVESHAALHKKVLHSIVEDMQEFMKENPPSAADKFPALATNNTQKFFDKRVDQYEKEIVAKCYNGSVAALYEKCPAYKTTSAKVWAEFMRRSEEKDETTKQVLAEVHKKQQDFHNLHWGLHKSKWVCWNCGAEAARNCTGCGAAKYCNRDCQVKGWKEGHKHHCSPLKDTHARFLHDLEIVDEAFSDPECHVVQYGVLPSVSDFQTLSHFSKVSMMESILERRMPGFFGEHRIRSEDISMKHFYSNVKRVVHEGFWFEPRPPKTITPKECDVDDESFEYISLALMVNYSTDETDPWQRAKMFSAFLKNLIVDWTADVDPFAHGPEDWLYMYSTKVPPENLRQKEAERFRTAAKLGFYEWMREKLTVLENDPEYSTNPVTWIA